MPKRALIIHGHFYQPAREDPNTGEIPKEEGAQPYRNWNEKIHNSCYRPNAEMGNFEHISFDLGPTLSTWMLSHDPQTFARIVSQERRNFKKFGIGNGMAQSYHHTILPLATRHDKTIQVHWGLADFEYRFGHPSAGLWLPEAAVDTETLEVLAEQGVAFTILAPWQVEVGTPDTTQPYTVELPSGKEIAVFLYDADLSMRVSFDPGATSNGDTFLSQYINPRFACTGVDPEAAQMVILASDGELYGHHQPFRDKFLAYLTKPNGNYPSGVGISFPGLWLLQNPPTEKICIRERTSWSCHHGVARWSKACECAENGTWKSPLRNAIEQVAALVDQEYVKKVSAYLEDPWKLLYEYIDVMHGKRNVQDLIFSLIGKQVSNEEIKSLDYLLRAQYNKQRSFTSCGWYFEDFDRLEPRNNVIFAAQAIWWTRLASGADYIQQARQWFSTVQSWRTGLRADTVFSAHLDRVRFEQLSFPFMNREPERY